MGLFTRKMKLVHAVQQNDLHSVQRLLAQGHLIDRLNNRRLWRRHQGRTALMVAAEAGHLQVMQVLLDMGADSNRRNEGGCTALWLAASRGHVAAVELLVQHGANVTLDGCDEPRHLFIPDGSIVFDTPLHRAVYGQQFQDICERLHCPLVNSPNDPALLTISFTTSISSGADAAKAESGSVARFRRLVLLLIHGGAQLDAKDNRGRTALQIAINLGCASAARVLSQLHGAMLRGATNRLSRVFEHHRLLHEKNSLLNEEEENVGL